MRFLVDRCAGHRLAEWLRSIGHDVVEIRDLGPDPGDAEILKRAVLDRQIVVTIDTDFGELVFHRGHSHSGLVRLPDVPAAKRIALMEEVLARFSQHLDQGAVVTVRGDRIRVATTS